LFPSQALEFFELRKKGEIETLEKPPRYRKVVTVIINGREYKVGVEGVDLELIALTTGAPVTPTTSISPVAAKTTSSSTMGGKKAFEGEPVAAPMAGKILKIHVKPGMSVNKGDKLATLESMKMETEIIAPRSGVITGIVVKEGDRVEQGQTVLYIK